MPTADSTSMLYVETVVPSTDDIEEEEDPCNAPSTNTMLDENHIDPSNTILSFAPGEGKRPVFHEPLAEYLYFPTIFSGQEHPSNAKRICPLYQRDIFKYELCSVDTRVASNIPNIFWKAKHKQAKNTTASMLLDKDQFLLFC